MQDKLIEAEIDDGILGVVLVLNDAGVKTFSSCQGGGYGWGHGYLRPIVCFDGDDSEGERAEKIATDAGYQVFQVQRVWYTRDGERVGPFWEMEFVAGAACRAPKDRAAVRAHDAGTTPAEAVNYAAIDRGWRMFCQSCGTDAPCPNCEVCGALLTMVQNNDADAGTDERESGFICAAWRKRLEGPMHARRTLVNRCDLPDGHDGKHLDHVLLVSWADDQSVEECRPRNEWNDPPAYHAAESAPQLDAEDPAEPVEDVVSRMCELMGGCACEHCIKRMTAALAVAREGYVKLEDALDPPDDIECALADKGERQRWQDAVREAFKVRRAHLAPKPEPTLAEEIDKILLKHNIRTVTSENVVCNSAVSAELAALVERRTK